MHVQTGHRRRFWRSLLRHILIPRSPQIDVAGLLCTLLLGNTEHPATPAAVVLLSSSGAALCADENGMIPLHYACA